ncbi:hypothetical protein [Bdellovibrio bacteriovorus]|uniref:hypothetical protein n=1 Tax=Bdellovibrio bacteriovorus TaxID=959 RepID=UPI003AA87A26
MNQRLGVVQFPDLDGYIVRGEDLHKFQTYGADKTLAAMIASKTPGVLFGGEIQHVAGLNFKILESAVLFDDLTVGIFPDIDFVVEAADPANDRMDRVELTYEMVDGSTVINIMMESKVFDKVVHEDLHVAAGIPGGAVPAKTLGHISLGIITVPAGAVALDQNSVDQTFDVAFMPSATKISDGAFARFNPKIMSVEISSDGGTTWKSLATIFQNKVPVEILNNQVAAADMVGLVLDTSVSKFFAIDSAVFRKTDDESRKAGGQVIAIFDEDLAAWEFVSSMIGTDPGLEFSAIQIGATSKYQMQYVSDNVPGAGYQGSGTFTIKDL